MNDFDTFKKLPNNVGNLGKIIVASGFEWLLKVQKIVQSGHTAYHLHFFLFKQTKSSKIQFRN